MKRLPFVAALLFFVWTGGPLFAKVKIHRLKSPDGQLELQVTVDGQITYTLLRGTQCLLAPAELSMTLDGGKILGRGARLKHKRQRHCRELIPSPFYRHTQCTAAYNQLDFTFKENFGIQFRLYDNGMAYRFCTSMPGEIKVLDEKATFRFGADYEAYIPYTTGKDNLFGTSFENRYTKAPLSAFRKETVAFSPVLVCLDGGVRMILTEGDLEDYPGMFFKTAPIAHRKGAYELSGVFAPVPAAVEADAVRCRETVKTYSEFMAVTRGTRHFPWRIVGVNVKDKDLLVNDLVYMLAAPNRVGDVSWIKPGKVAWDWWNHWGIVGVDFEAGINTPTYKRYIDFAAANGMAYVVLDEGWSPSAGGDMKVVVPEVDLPDLVRYAGEKGVGLLLWVVAYTLDKDLEAYCRHYASMGIKGFKVDFIDRDDQHAVRMVWRLAEAAARYHLLLDFHGIYKPCGLNRTWPNVLNFEGVWGLEQMKWDGEGDMVTYDVTFPFIRQFSGPVDYTQGAMRNAAKEDYRPVYRHPMSQGTRAHQVAAYVVFDSPLVMLCDSPTAYEKERETTDYIAGIPVVWEETRALAGEIGSYLVTARRVGTHWYIGGLNNWEARTLNLDLSFLPAGTRLRFFRDGVNAGRTATDYILETVSLPSDGNLKVQMAPGGGFALVPVL